MEKAVIEANATVSAHQARLARAISQEEIETRKSEIRALFGTLSEAGISVEELVTNFSSAHPNAKSRLPSWHHLGWDAEAWFRGCLREISQSKESHHSAYTIVENDLCNLLLYAQHGKDNRAFFAALREAALYDGPRREKSSPRGEALPGSVDANKKSSLQLGLLDKPSEVEEPTSVSSDSTVVGPSPKTPGLRTPTSPGGRSMTPIPRVPDLDSHLSPEEAKAVQKVTELELIERMSVDEMVEKAKEAPAYPLRSLRCPASPVASFPAAETSPLRMMTQMSHEDRCRLEKEALGVAIKASTPRQEKPTTKAASPEVVPAAGASKGGKRSPGRKKSPKKERMLLEKQALAEMSTSPGADRGHLRMP